MDFNRHYFKIDLGILISYSKYYSIILQTQPKMSNLRTMTGEAMNMKGASCCSITFSYECPCGWKVTSKEERRKDILNRLHGKTCETWRGLSGKGTKVDLTMVSDHLSGKREIKQQSKVKITL